MFSKPQEVPGRKRWCSLYWVGMELPGSSFLLQDLLNLLLLLLLLNLNKCGMVTINIIIIMKDTCLVPFREREGLWHRRLLCVCWETHWHSPRAFKYPSVTKPNEWESKCTISLVFQ